MMRAIGGLNLAALVICAGPALAQLPAEYVSGRIMDAEFADFDGDGVMDVAVAGEHSPNHVLFGDGSGGFAHDPDRALPAVGYDSEDIAIADFDGDGDADLVFASEDNQINEYYRNLGDGGWENAIADLPTRGTSNAVIAGDVDGDGDADLLFGNAGRNRVLINDGAGVFVDESDDRLPPTIDVTQDLELGDIDGDGDLDLLVGNEDANRLLVNDGTGRFTDVSASALPLRSGAEETREADFGDVDGDGDLDIYFANVGFRAPDSTADRLLLNDGRGRFTASENALPSGDTHTLDADFVDIDGDGDLDVVRGGAFGGGLSVLVNDGSGRFALAAEMAPVEARTLDVIDVEQEPGGDGRFYVTNFQSADQIVVLGSSVE